MLRRVLGLLIVLAVIQVGPALTGAADAASSTRPFVDPVIGPHARDEAAHRSQPLALAAATTRPQPRHSAQAVSSAPTVSAPAPRLRREIFGFAPYWQLSNEANWNYSLLSTVAYFGLTVNGDGSFSTGDSGWTGWNSQALVDMINRAHQQGDRVVLVVKQFNEATINQIVTSSTVTQAAINNSINAVIARNLDGVNIDFEGYISSAYPGIQAGLTNFVAQMTSQLHQRWPGAEVSVDTYSGSASWDGGFMNITDLAPVTDAIFVMAYDMASGNTPGQASATAPLNGWTYNDTTSVQQYLSKAPASKILLGVPYYGYKWSTTSSAPNATTVGGATSDTYAGVLSDFNCGAQNLSHNWDVTAASPWAAWWSPAVNDPCGGNHNSWRELYYDDARSLGLKYDLVNQANLRGTGMWALGYDSGSSDLWDELQLKFVYPFRGMYTLEAYGGVHGDGGSLPLNVSAYWYGWQIARAAALLPDATGGYVLDGYGALHAFGAATPVNVSAYWSSPIARDVVLLPGSSSSQAQGYVLDAFGALHPFGGAPDARATGSWNWDAARRAVMLSDGTGGYVLDLYGGLHPFSVGTNPMPSPITNAAYWPGWAIASDLALAPGSTAGSVAGVTLDGFGAVHPFGAAGKTTVSAYWPNWNIARSVRFSPASTAANPQGWVLDGFGGVHAFGGAPALNSVAYWPNHDVARQLLVQ